MKDFKITSFSLFSLVFVVNLASGQAISRPRIVDTETKPPNQRPLVRVLVIQSATNQVLDNLPPQIYKNVDVKPSSAILNKKSIVPSDILNNSLFNPHVTISLFSSIQSKLGIPYRYASEGPTSYDCSGFIWSIFQDAGIELERTSAKGLWAMSEPVSEEEKYKFGTLVFFNRLGHVGIVADEKGFFHASRTKGVTYSPFAGYWEKRIVGFRKLPVTKRKDEGNLLK